MPRLKINISEKNKRDYSLMSKNQKEEFLRFAALGITDISAVKIDNFLLESANYFETPHHEFAYFMSKPENFWFTCKWLFNIDLHPFQVVILQELWKRKFPMLIGCRGMGKTFILALYAFLRAIFTPNSKIVVVGAAFRQSRLIFEYIENFYRNSPVLQSICEDKPRRDIDRCFFNVNKSLITAIPIGCLSPDSLITTNNGIYELSELKDKTNISVYGNSKFKETGFFYDAGIVPTKKVTTKRGYSYTGTHNHKMLVVRNNQIVWVRTDEMVVGDRILIDATLRWHNNDSKLSLEDCYKLGEDGVLNNDLLISSWEKIENFVNGLIASKFCDKKENNLKFHGLEHDFLKKLQYILLHFGIISTFKNNELNLYKDYNHYKNNYYVDEIESITDSISQQMYDINIPEDNQYCANGFYSHNTGEKIRGLRANYIIADEFASITPEIYEVVIKGFGSVSSNPTKKAEKIGKINILKQLGEYEQAQNIEDTIGMGNQSIVSGTAYYAFNHFYSYWKRYKSIIKSGGDEKYLRDIIFQSSEIPDGFNWKDYSIMRIPYTILPPGFMDDANIASSRANVHKAIYLMEYEGIFAEDSDGFFKRSLIESCVAHSEKPVVVSDGTEVTYNAGLHGDPNGVYIYGIDPASERDNLALVILQVLPTHRRIVYCWTFNKLKLRKRLEGREHKTGYYNYCARHIRSLLKVFPSKHIGIDSQGGGIQLIESLHNPSDMLEGEQPIWPYIKEKNTLTPDPFWWESDDKPTDGEKGLHIIHSINFVNAEFTSQSNHGLRKDFEDKRVLFPAYNTVVLAEAQGLDQLYNREIDKNDTLEDVVLDIEELKDELATIEHSQTNNQGRDKWDTPEVKKPGGKIGRLRKDRYSALLIANMIARTIELKLKGQEYYFAGGAFAGQEPSFKQRNNGLYIGPDYIVKNAPPQHSYKGVRRGDSF